MRILLLGASGGCGRHVLAQGVARGHAVTAVARPGTPIEVPPGAALVRADPLDGVALRGAVDGHDVVIACLGIKRVVPANPWSALASPPDFSERWSAALVEAMVARGLRRLLCVSAAGVGDSAPALNAVMRFFLATSNVGVAYRDLARMEANLAASGLDWHACRPTRLTDGPLTGKARVTDTFGTFDAIARADVADWLLRRAEDGATEPRTPIVTG